MPGKLPRVQVDNFGAFYLAPENACGAEALIYMQSYNEAIRQEHERSGFKMVSVCAGDFGESGDNRLLISPPDDETINKIIATLKARVPTHQAKVKAEVDELAEALKDNLLDSDERKLIGQRKRQLMKILAAIPQSQPTFNELRQFFWSEHRMRLAAQVPQEMRSSLNLLMEERALAEKQATWTKEAEAEAGAEAVAAEA